MLSVDVFRDPMASEPRILAGLTTRGLAAVCVMVPPSALCVAGAVLWNWPTELVAVILLAVDILPALWGFWRPEGLKPERWLTYAWRDIAGPRFIYFDGPARLTRGPGKPTIRER